MSILSSIISDGFRILTFRRPSTSLDEKWPAYLAFGLLFTWLAGVGRYWDNPRADLWQHLGLGSLTYVFCLALILWILSIPLRPNRWSYRNVLIFVSLTSPPAILYAIPVEKFVSMEVAQALNSAFLAFVASWRISLLYWFMRRFAGLDRVAAATSTLLPLALIVVVLAELNLEHAVFDLMSGIRPELRTSGDVSFGVVSVLSVVSYLLSPGLLFVYLLCVRRARGA